MLRERLVPATDADVIQIRLRDDLVALASEGERASPSEVSAMTADHDDPVHASRLLRVLNFVIQPFFGTIWWVLDSEWKSRLPQFVPREAEDAKAPRHPGVGLRTEALERLLDPVPMLLGSSGRQGPVVVRGLTEGLGSDYPTSFGGILRPASFDAIDFIRFKRGKLEKEERPILPSLGKHRLDDAEEAELASFLKRRGLAVERKEETE